MTKRKFKKAIKRLGHLPGGLNLLKYLANKLNAFRLKIVRSTKVAYPSAIMIEGTNLCNLRCITCPREYEYGANMNKGNMDITKLKQIVDEIYPYIDSIGLTGLGETFLYKELVGAVEYIRAKSLGIIISTSINAHLKKSPEIARSLVGLIDTIQVSIDGIGEVYNKVRIGGDYTFFLDNLKEIVLAASETDTDVMLNMVLVKENYHQMTQMVELAHDLGIRYLSMTTINLSAVTGLPRDYYNLFFTEDYLDELSKAVAYAKRLPDLEFIHPNPEAPVGFNQCGFPWGHFYITWDGYIPPCCAKPFPLEKSFGSVIEKPLLDALNSVEFRKFRELWFNNETPEYCEQCHQIDLKPWPDQPQ